MSTLDGHDGPVIDFEPQDSGECVNVESVCASCGAILNEVSFSREGWEFHLRTLAGAEDPKPKRKRA